MKRLFTLAITIVLIIITKNQTMGQCSVDAGSDITVCAGMGVFEQSLGGSMVIENGTFPYTYAWSCSFSIGTFELNASDFLNDTTLANPELTNSVDDSLTFDVLVTDLNGNTCWDTLVVYFCHSMLTLEDKQTTIVQGDTANLYPGVFGNCAPVTYQWTPNYNISDPNVQYPSVWPDTTTYYIATAIDSAGCEMTDASFKVFVNPLSTIELGINTSVKLFPNPMTDFVVFEFSGVLMDNLRIELYDVQGRIVSKTNVSGDRLEMKRGDLQAGLYIYRIFQGNEGLGEGKLVVE